MELFRDFKDRSCYICGETPAYWGSTYHEINNRQRFCEKHKTYLEYAEERFLRLFINSENK